MNTFPDPTLVRRWVANLGITIQPPEPPKVIGRQRPKCRRPRMGKNITMARQWLTKRTVEFDYHDMAKAIKISQDTARYLCRQLADNGETKALPKANHNHPTKYLRVNQV